MQAISCEALPLPGTPKGVGNAFGVYLCYFAYRAAIVVYMVLAFHWQYMSKLHLLFVLLITLYCL